MPEHFSPTKRSEIMRAVKPKNTSPEKRVRSVAHRLGLRFRLHKKELPGSPDLLFPKRKTALFVHGCFWHRHEDCPRATVPKTNTDFWCEKFKRNMERDKETRKKLEESGWRVLIIWECETKSRESIEAFLSRNLLEQS